MDEYKIDTKCLHSGYEPKNGEPRSLPIYQSTTFKYDSAAEMGKLFDLESNGYFYSRLANPTDDFVAAKIADLEGGVGAVLTSSGQAATFYSLFNIVSAGDHIVASTAIYGGSFNLMDVTMRRMGIDTTFVDPDASQDELDAAFKPNTKVVFAETLSNPSLIVLDIEKFASAAHRHGVPLIIDNTFATPVNCRPIEFGADIVTHSTTKYMDGHASTIGGAIVDSGNFDWSAYPVKFACLCEPDESYHGVVYTQRFGQLAYIQKIVAQLMRDLGSIQAPQNAFLLNLGLESLPIRMQRHCENATSVAEYLSSEPKAAWVEYPSLPGNKYYNLAQKYMPHGTCGVVSFGVAGGRDAAARFLDSLKLVTIATHVADARSCVLHPASTTHRQMSEDQLNAAGVRSDLVRLSVGLENAGDIITDLKQAFSKI